MNETKSEKFFVILPNFEFAEYISLDHALKVEEKLVIAVQQRIVDTVTQKIRFSLVFVNNGETTEGKQIKAGDWSALLSVIYDSDNGNYSPRFKFCGPDGLLKEFNTQGGRGIYGVVLAVKKLYELKNFNGWQDFELSEENKRLKIENEALKNKVIELQNEIVVKNTSV